MHWRRVFTKANRLWPGFGSCFLPLHQLLGRVDRHDAGAAVASGAIEVGLHVVELAVVPARRVGRWQTQHGDLVVRGEAALAQEVRHLAFGLELVDVGVEVDAVQAVEQKATSPSSTSLMFVTLTMRDARAHEGRLCRPNDNIDAHATNRCDSRSQHGAQGLLHDANTLTSSSSPLMSAQSRRWIARSPVG